MKPAFRLIALVLVSWMVAVGGPPRLGLIAIAFLLTFVAGVSVAAKSTAKGLIACWMLVLLSLLLIFIPIDVSVFQSPDATNVRIMDAIESELTVFNYGHYGINGSPIIVYKRRPSSFGVRYAIVIFMRSRQIKVLSPIAIFSRQGYQYIGSIHRRDGPYGARDVMWCIKPARLLSEFGPDGSIPRDR